MVDCIICSPGFPPSTGGMENQVFDLATGLARRGHNVQVLTGPLNTDRTQPTTPDLNLAYHPYTYSETPSRLSVDRSLDYFGYLADKKKFQEALTAKLTEAAAPGSILHLHDFHLYPWMVAPILQVQSSISIPVIVTIHSVPATRTGFTALTLPSTNWTCITPSRWCARQIQKMGVETNRIHIIPNGIDTKTFKPNPTTPPDRERQQHPPESKLVLCPRRFSPEKGQQYLIQAAPQILEKEPNTRFIFTGGGSIHRDIERSQLTRLRTMTRALVLERCIEFRLHIQRHEMPQLYRDATLTAIPSTQETFGLSALESIACGTPVVATRTGGLPEVITDRETGLITNTQDPNDLANKITKLLGDKKQRQTMARKGPQTARNKFSIKQMVNSTLTLYKKIIQSNELPR